MSRETEEREKGAEQALALGERRRLIYGLQLWAQVRGQESRELVLGSRVSLDVCDCEHIGAKPKREWTSRIV